MISCLRCRWVKDGRLTIAATPGMQQTESLLATAAENLASAAKTLDALSLESRVNRNELQNLSFGLEIGVKHAMLRHLCSKEPPLPYAEDSSLCHIRRDTIHISADPSRKKPSDFSFDAAFVVDRSGTSNIWVGEVRTKLTRHDVATANKKKDELQEYINKADIDTSREAISFQRQAGQLKFLRGRKVKLFVGGARVMSDAEAEIEKVSCAKIMQNGGQFDVVEP